MVNRLLAELRSRLGSRGLIAVLLAPILAAAVTAALLPTLVKSDVQASAKVTLYPAIGTHAAYEVSSYVADFVSAYTSPDAEAKAAEAAGDAASGQLSATREGDNAGAVVTYTAPTAEAATAGLRAATHEALAKVVRDDVARRQMELQGAQAAITRTTESFATMQASGSVSAADLSAARQEAITAAARGAQEAESSLAVGQIVEARVPQMVQEIPVTTAELSSMRQQIQIVATAAVSAFVLALVVTLLVRRRRTSVPTPS